MTTTYNKIIPQKYPEHNKLSTRHEQLRAARAFLEFLEDTKKISLRVYSPHLQDMIFAYQNVVERDALLHEFVGVDYAKIRKERDDMADAAGGAPCT